MSDVNNPEVQLKKYGERAYHVFLDGEHWGNVCGYEKPNSAEVSWSSVVFVKPSCSDCVAAIDELPTRSTAVQEIIIETAPDRRYR